tara:strand:+ start:171 stop:464 length:294 start_codon:yes stop_codon:yes gene_type:complete
MSILNKLNNNDSNLSKLDGRTPKIPNLSDSKLNSDLSQGNSNLTNLNGSTPNSPNLAGSKLHNLYSTIGNPLLRDKPKPSNLDPEPPAPKYLDNLPG